MTERKIVFQKHNHFEKNTISFFLDDEKIGWPLAGTLYGYLHLPLPPRPPGDAAVGTSRAATPSPLAPTDPSNGRPPYPQIIPTPSHKHPHAVLHSLTQWARGWKI